MKTLPLRLLLGAEQPCGYLPNRLSRSAFVAPHSQLNGGLYGALIAHGFRRSGDYAYRPACQTCCACVPVRVPVSQFTPNRSQRRCISRNADLRVEVLHGMSTEHFTLYRKYLLARHPFGGMDADDEKSFHEFLGSRWGVTEFWCFYRKDELCMVAVVDRVADGLSAVYTFFDPEHSDRGLGTYAVITQIAAALREGLEYLYLGYWVSGSPTMEYKRNFNPLERFDGHFWRPFPPDEADFEGALPGGSPSTIMRAS